MKNISDDFMENLKNGFLTPLIKRVQLDSDLDLEIREKSINIYFKGNSLLKLEEQANHKYRTVVHPKIKGKLPIPSYLIDEKSTSRFVQKIPLLKENIVLLGKKSIEIEYEQLIIRANNYEKKTNSDIFILDRQFVSKENKEENGRFDMIGIYWERKGRRKYQEVPLCLIEVKFALNTDINEVDEQLEGYHKILKRSIKEIAEKYQDVLKKKIELGLFAQSKDRIGALRTLSISDKLSDVVYIVVLIDYNPYSKLFDYTKINRLTFSSRVKVMKMGFAIWEKNSKDKS